MNRTVLIVGNAAGKNPFPELCLQYDEVIRINRFRTVGFEPMVGPRTTIIALNPTVPLVDVETGPCRHFWIQSETQRAEIEKAGRSAKLMADLDTRMFSWPYYRRHMTGKKSPWSIGILSVFHALQIGWSPTIVNFDWAITGHYYSDEPCWEGHNWDGERAIAFDLECEGRLQIIN